MLTLETPYFSRGLTLVVVTASINKEWIMQAQILHRRGIRIFCVLIDPFSFGGSEPSDNLRQIDDRRHLAGRDSGRSFPGAI